MVTPRKYHVLYPNDMWLTEDDIERRFRDAIAANELCTNYLDARTPDDMADALHEAGFIRLSGEAPIMIEQSAVGICCRNSAMMLAACDDARPDLQKHNRGQAELLLRAADIADDMLAALKQIHHYETIHDPNRGELYLGAIRAVEQAIAKAGGEGK
jgi:hypothetical protein